MWWEKGDVGGCACEVLIGGEGVRVAELAVPRMTCPVGSPRRGLC